MTPLDPWADLRGSHAPTHLLRPTDVAYSDIQAAIDIFDCVGLQLAQWQILHLTDMLSRRVLADGSTKWAALEVLLELSRRNGKSVVAEARSLAGIYVFRERRIVYSAHRGSASTEAFRRIDDMIDSDPELKREVKIVRAAVARESIEFRSHGDEPSQVLRFVTRTAGNARSLEADCLIVDEVQDARDEHIASVLPLVTGRSKIGDPQVVFMGSAGYKSSVVLARLVKRVLLELALRARGEAPQDKRLLGYRWAADLDTDDPSSPQTWAKTNPMLGILMTPEAIEAEYRSMGAAIDPTYFAAERLGVGQYPREEGEEWVIPRRRVEEANLAGEVEITGPVMLAVEVHWNRQSASISAAGRTADGTKIGWLQAAEVGTAWVVSELQRLTREHETFGVLIDPQSPANSLVGPLRDAGVPMVFLTYKDISAAWGAMFDALATDTPTLRLLKNDLLLASFAAADTRDVSGARTWKRTTEDDSTAVIALTWAAYMLDQAAKPIEPAALPAVASGAGSVPAANAPQFNVRVAKF